MDDLINDCVWSGFADLADILLVFDFVLDVAYDIHYELINMHEHMDDAF